jgi:hypothetical protein
MGSLENPFYSGNDHIKGMKLFVLEVDKMELMIVKVDVFGVDVYIIDFGVYFG